MIKQSYDWKVIKEVINHNFTFADVAKRFEGVDSSTGNIFCPFHDNTDTPAAKMYWDEEREMWVIWCFSEHKHFTVYDYVNLILCDKYQRYSSPFQFLKERMPDSSLGTQLEVYKKRVAQLEVTSSDKKKEYINNLFMEKENVIDFVESLYTA